MADSLEKLARTLGVRAELLERLDAAMAEKRGTKDILAKLMEKNEGAVAALLMSINSKGEDAHRVQSALRDTLFWQEKELYKILAGEPGKDHFEKAASLAKKMARVGKGSFLKKDHILNIFLARPPQNLLAYLKYKDVEELLKKEDPTECFSALRFVESNEWMHETFEKAYSAFTRDDFEERDIEIRVLGPQWQEIAEKFVAKKHHNVSHLKEFGVIFLNPIQENLPGKFLRDFALLLHYFHEIQFYSKLFGRYFPSPDFADYLKSLLRGDVKEASALTDPGEWLIVQRYLVKEDLKDPRLFLPRVNPESLHWARGERDIANYTGGGTHYSLKIWGDLDWVSEFFPSHDGEKLVSFDLEDNAMSLVSFMEGKQEFFTYHQREALWTKMFLEYVGGEDKMEELIIENFEKGVVKF